MLEKPAFFEKRLYYIAEKAPCRNLHPLCAMYCNLERVPVPINEIFQQEPLADLEIECSEIVEDRQFILRLGHDIHCVSADKVEADAGLLVIDQIPVPFGFALTLALDEFPGEQLVPVDKGDKIIPHGIKEIQCFIGSRPCLDPVARFRAETIDSSHMHVSCADIADSPVHREIQLLAHPVRHPGNRVCLLGHALKRENHRAKN